MPKEHKHPAFDTEKAFRLFGIAEEERAVIRRSRTVLLTDSEIDGCTSGELTKDIFILASETSKKPIHLIISSEGGSLWSCLAIIRAIRYAQSRKIKVFAHVFGNAFSAAFLILQACDKRTMGSESLLMMHGISSFPMGDLKNLQTDLDMVKSVTASMCEMVAAKNTAKDLKYHNPQHWAPIMEDSTPRYFRAKEAIDTGLIDEIDL